MAPVLGSRYGRSQHHTRRSRGHYV